MGKYVKCPKCGSQKCQLTDKAKHRGFLYFLVFGVFWLIYAMIKWTIGIMVFLCFDWWYAIIMKARKKAYHWHCKKWFTKRNSYYCQDCGFNFKA